LEIRTAKRIRRIGTILFLLYILVLVYLMFFFEAYDRNMENRRYLYNLVPFREIRRFIVYRETLGFSAVAGNLIGNIAGFMPFGFILPILYKKRRNWRHVTLLTMEFSLLIEIIQLVLRVGCCDVDDIILNTFGGLLGYILFYICNRIRRKIDG